eukprot:755914-Hanusia_phi.AAC.2
MDLDENHQLTAAEIYEVIKIASKNPCHGVETITDISGAHLVSTFLPKKCMYIIQPNWFTPKPPPGPAKPPTCQVYTPPLRSLSENFLVASHAGLSTMTSLRAAKRKAAAPKLLVKAQRYSRYHMADRKKHSQLMDQLPRTRSAATYTKHPANRKLLQYADNMTTNEMYDYLVFLPQQACDF